MRRYSHYSATFLLLVLMVAMTLVISVAVSSANGKKFFPKRHFSNSMYFGDSFTDFGNGPDSLTFDGEPLEDPKFFTSNSGIFNNIYVPMSNPVNRRRDRILPGLKLRFPPTNRGSRFFRLTLPPQLPLCSDQGCVKKRQRSLNWAEYVVYNGVLKRLLAPGADLRPWLIQLDETEVSIRQSVNYAFYSALSGEGCANVNLFPLPCTIEGQTLQESIFTAQNEYRTKQSETDAAENALLRATVIIPAFHTQIDMFEANVNAGQVLINDRTLFLVYTGANDLAAAFFQFQSGAIDLEQFLELLTFTIPGEIAGGVERLVSLGAKNIVVLGQFNLGITPRLLADVDTIEERHAVAAEIDELVTLFNLSLEDRIENMANKRIAFVDIQTPIRKAANSLIIGGQEGYFFSIGEQCVDETAGTVQQGKAVSCFKRNVPLPIGFWNLSHLGTQYNQIIASAVLDKLTPRRSPKHKIFRFLKKLFSKFNFEQLDARLTEAYRE